MSSIGPRAGGLRLIRIVLVAVAVGVTLNSTANVVLWRLNAARVDQINKERARTIYRDCVDTNERHDRTVGELARLVAHMPDGPRKERAKQGIRGTVLLIDALSPKRDCGVYARQQANAK